MSAFDRAIVSLLPFVPKPLVWTVSKRYVAGESIDAMARTVAALNGRGMAATASVLGEHVANPAEADNAVRQFVAVLEEATRFHLNTNISVKLTQLGLQIDRDLCEENLRKILASAREHENFVRIDMEDSSCTSVTLELFRKVRRDFENVGVVIQAYLRRSYEDVVALAAEGANVRVCKGIYIEPRAIAYKDPEIIRRNFMHLVNALLSRGCYVGIATHDERLVWEGLRAAENLGLDKDRYEFQMLLGVDEELRRILLDAGHRLRVYVPFGPQWHAYSLRRLRENPRIARYVIEATLRGK
jgi:proline dehydrogenase